MNLNLKRESDGLGSDLLDTMNKESELFWDTRFFLDMHKIDLMTEAGNQTVTEVVKDYLDQINEA